MHNAVSIAATQWTELGFPTSVSGPHKETQNVSEEVKGDLLDTRSTHAYYTQFLRDCCSIFQLLQLVRFLYDARNEHGIKPPILWLLYSHKCNKAMAREKERKASCLHIIRSLFKLQNFLSPPQTCQACRCPASLPLHYPSIHLWALRDNYLSCPRFYVCHIFGKRWFQSWILAIFCCFNKSVNSNMSTLTEIGMDCDFLGRYKNYDLADSWCFYSPSSLFFVVTHSAFFPMKTRKLSLQMLL